MLVVAFITAVCFSGNYIVSNISLPRIFYYNDTASLPRGLYMKAFTDSPVKRGDYVIFRPNEETIKIALERGYIASQETLFLKKVGGIAGDRYYINPFNRHFTINNQYIGEVCKTDSKNRELPQLSGYYDIPDGHFLPVGVNPRSFDGRYTKTVPIANIVCKVVPILTE